MEEMMNNEVTETEETLSPMVMALEPDVESEGGSGKTLPVILAIGAGVAAAGAVVYKKLKAKKTGVSKKKTRKRLRWVEEPIEDEEEFLDDFIEESKEPIED